jgi:hypothetical protein
MESCRTHAQRPMKTLLSLLVSCAVGLFPLHSWGEIAVHDNTVVFTQEKKPTGDPEIVKHVTAFEKDLRIGGSRRCIDLALPHSLLFNLKRTIIQGVKFAVPPNGRFAVLLSYVCSQPLLAAEVPYRCESCAAVLDSDGYVTHRLKGNFLWIVPHESLPYFALIEDYCCDVQGKAYLYDLSGKKLCEGFLSKDLPHLSGPRFTCGTTWRNGDLVDRKEIRLKGEQLRHDGGGP